MLDQLKIYFEQLLGEVQKIMDYLNRILNIDLL